MDALRSMVMLLVYAPILLAALVLIVRYRAQIAGVLRQLFVDRDE